MVGKILCVAEKPSIAKAVANHLGGNVPAVCLIYSLQFDLPNQPQRNVPGLAWLKNYEFDYSFDPPWGHCNVVMTSVAGHLIKTEFDSRYKNWASCSPADLFDAALTTSIEDVCFSQSNNHDCTILTTG